jgi:serine protease AprX
MKKFISTVSFINITVVFLGACSLTSAQDINAKVAQLDINTANLDDVIRIFGEPEKYLWQRNTFTKDNLPSIYIAAYPDDFYILIARDKIRELRFEGPGSGYTYRGKIRYGSPLDEVIKVVGRPKEIIQKQPMPTAVEDGVLYKDINGRKGYCYYERRDLGVRFFFLNYNVTALYVTRARPAEAKRDSSRTAQPVKSVEQYDDMRWKDLSKLDLSGRKGLTPTLRFNQKTLWPQPDKMPPGDKPDKVLKDGMNPGLGIRRLHKQGITGKGVNVAIIDQPLYQDHPEFVGKIVAYHDVGCDSKSSMHGPAVASLLVGKICGTAPDARLYYAAAPSWTKDTAYQAQALNWIIEQNKKQPASKKIRVVSVSAAPSGSSSPFDKNQQMWDRACAQAEAEDILVLDCTAHHGFISPCWYDRNAPESVIRCTPGLPGRESRTYTGRILVPTCPRTTAEEYEKGDFSYQYCGRGGLSWAIPYCAGVLALGWQIKPEIGPEQMRDLLFKSAYIHKSGDRIINPNGFIRLVRRVKVAPVTRKKQ